MTAIYADMIEIGMFDFNDVPSHRKSDVEAELLSRGYEFDTEGDE